MAEEIKAEEKAKSAGEKKPGEKKGGFWGKYKWYIIGGGVVLLGLFWYMSRSSSQNAQNSQATSQQQAASGVDPATGYEYGSPADLAALGGSGSVTATPGPAGATGATGATGARGPAGSGSNGLFKLSFAQAQKLAGKGGSSNLFYTSGSATHIVQGKYANDKNVTYYTTPQAAVKAGFM